jgi:hypothetical protein
LLPGLPARRLGGMGESSKVGTVDVIEGGAGTAEARIPEAMPPEAIIDADIYGALVGWTHSEFNGRLDLRLQSARNLRGKKPGDIQTHHLLMTQNQALLLGNYLLKLSGRQPPIQRKRGWLKRIFG